MFFVFGNSYFGSPVRNGLTTIGIYCNPKKRVASYGEVFVFKTNFHLLYDPIYNKNVNKFKDEKAGIQISQTVFIPSSFI